MLALRPMTEADLPAVGAWLLLPHVAHWWTPDTTAEAEIAKYRERVRREDNFQETDRLEQLGRESKPATHMLMIIAEGAPVGWCLALQPWTA